MALDFPLKLEPVQPPHYIEPLVIMVAIDEYKVTSETKLTRDGDYVWYRVRLAQCKSELRWRCDCEANGNLRHCKHIRRVQERQRIVGLGHYAGMFERATSPAAQPTPVPRRRNPEDDDPDIDEYSAPGPSREQRARVALAEALADMGF